MKLEGGWYLRDGRVSGKLLVAAAGPAPTVPMRLAQDTVEVGLCTKQDAGVIAG
jgi:hypothetical protein